MRAYIADMFIETETTPNPSTLKFLPGRSVMPGGSREFVSHEDAASSPLAEALFDLGDVTRVLFGEDFIAVSIASSTNWSGVKEQVVAAILDHYVMQAPLFRPGVADSDGAEPDAAMLVVEECAEDADIIAQINDLLDSRVRPALAGDGGNIIYRGYRDGIVYLQMQGACSGCPSASATLHHGITGLLQHYIPSVTEVRSA